MDIGSTDISISKVSLQHKSLRSHLIKGASGSLLIQVGFAGLAFLNSIILARLLGAGGYGTFANAIAWVILLVIPTTFGFGTLLVRNVAIYRSMGQWAELKGLLRFADIFVLSFSTLIALIFLAAARSIFSTPDEEAMCRSLWIAAPLIPLFALSSLRESSIRGLEHVLLSGLPSMIFRPGLLLTGIIGIYLLWPAHLNPATAMAVNVFAATIALIASIFWLRKNIPAETKHIKPEYKIMTWLKAAFPMLIFSGMQSLIGQTDIVMLGVLRSAKEVGLYAAANRLAYLLVYVMMATEIILAPIMARLYVNGEKEQLQKILTRAVRIAFFSVLPFGIILIFAGGNILAIFGHDFPNAKTALAILAVGRLADVAVGSGALLLNMSGHENLVAILFSGSALANVLLNALLIPRYGIEGAAFASIISLIVVMSLLSAYAAKNTCLHVTVFGTLLSERPVRINVK